LEIFRDGDVGEGNVRAVNPVVVMGWPGMLNDDERRQILSGRFFKSRSSAARQPADAPEPTTGKTSDFFSAESFKEES